MYTPVLFTPIAGLLAMSYTIKEWLISGKPKIPVCPLPSIVMRTELFVQKSIVLDEFIYLTEPRLGDPIVPKLNLGFNADAAVKLITGETVELLTWSICAGVVVPIPTFVPSS